MREIAMKQFVDAQPPQTAGRIVLLRILFFLIGTTALIVLVKLLVS